LRVTVNSPAECIFNGQRVGKGVPDGCVTRDPLSEFNPIVGAPSLKKFLNPTVYEPQAGFQLKYGLTDNREAEVARLDDPGVHRPDRDLVNTRAINSQERVRLYGLSEWPWYPSIMAHRIPPGWPMRMTD
jgi:hypothetical protein